MPHPLFSETIADWLAIGSLVGSLLIVVLARFNFWCAQNARRQAKASTEQACVALIGAERAKEQAELARKHAESARQHAALCLQKADTVRVAMEQMLAEMKKTAAPKSIAPAHEPHRHSAVDLLLCISQKCQEWSTRLTLPADGSPIIMVPPGLPEALAATIEMAPHLRDDIRIFQTRLDSADSTLRAFMEQPLPARSDSNKIATALGNHLDQIRSTAENLAFRIETHSMPAAWNTTIEEKTSGPHPRPALGATGKGLLVFTSG